MVLLAYLKYAIFGIDYVQYGIDYVVFEYRSYFDIRLI